VDYQRLQAELNGTLPNSLGYAGLTDQQAADKLNSLTTGRTVRRSDITPAELLEAIDLRDFVANPSQVGNATLAASWFESITQSQTIRLMTDAGQPTRVKANLDRLLSNAQNTQDRLAAIATKTVSRAVETQITSENEPVGAGHVTTARSGNW
jgi:hypothetical protein